ncbi:MAG TPA: PIG-L family deacetylase [Cyclobacteriaceae bacterium]|nr:PIG-L family deacetylase [Cyclobacteriaceae bacterium]
MRKLLFLILVLQPFFNFAQQSQPSAAQIKLKLKKLNFLGSVLYVAAHPDDENTRIITYMANDRLASTAYLSMTRGDGGQNLIGSEIRDLLGLIRTQELLAARRIDGGRQFFTRANDFGFSKSADETFKIWGKNDILSDVVRVFRQFQPDVIITRFPPDERAGHGHHTASAILAQEAFDAAAKSDQFPELVTQFGVWQAKGLYTNTGRWWNTSINENTPGIVSLNVGGYNPLLGESYSEIAAISRSQHKSQGFGSTGTRGYQPEFLEFVKGDKVAKDVFENVNTTWTRIKGGEKILPLVDKAYKEFNPESPSATVPALLSIRKAITALEPGVWRNRKLAEVDQLIKDCLGLYLSVKADHYWAAPAQKVVVSFELINRSPADVSIERIQSADLNLDSVLTTPLKNDVSLTFKSTKNITTEKQYSDPYWLHNDHGTGKFDVTDPNLIGKPENDPAISVNFTLKVAGEQLILSTPLVFKENDPVKGELTRPFEIVPPVFVNLTDAVIIFNDGISRDVKVIVKSSSDNGVKGNLTLQLPEGWHAEPASIPFELTKKGEEQTKVFRVTPSVKEMTATLTAQASIDGKYFNRAVQTISYDHIPTQTILPLAKAKIVKLDLKKQGNVIGYIKGAGDDIPVALRNMGYQVWEMKNEEVTAENLKRVDAVVMGIRAINTNERIPFMMKDLMEYVNNGGTMIVQYNTSNGLETESFSPYPLKLSRDRVTEEDAEVRILKPDHEVLNKPNLITSKDFEGWVQERGLYFPDKYDANYDAVLSMNDKSETPKDGSLLVTKYGNGHYVYTSLSFFRELPEGVAGAYRLFANIVSLGKNTEKPVSANVKRKKK